MIRVNEIKNEFSGGNDLPEGAAAAADEVVIAEAVAAAVQVVDLKHQLLLLLEVVGNVRSGSSTSFESKSQYHKKFRVEQLLDSEIEPIRVAEEVT